MSNIVLQATSITKWYQDPVPFKALDGVNLEIKKGEFAALVGKSGCGKSTLLYVLSTLDTRYEGELQIAGTSLRNANQNDLALFRNEHIGFVFQFHFLLPEFTVLQNVMIPALKRGIWSTDEVEDRAQSLLKHLGVQDQSLKLASSLSGGQQQRVAIARALINKPLIVMGDEPTGNLDSYNTEVVFEMLRNISTEMGQSIIAVTHDPEFAKRCDRVIEMVDGKIV
ncbi:MAG TPA: ABC transporter ATP-binding protein [Luteibaculaceae bacterium]|nr:ABC transporter ATP-binding protein [Luteibaculaceae bacterium]